MDQNNKKKPLSKVAQEIRDMAEASRRRQQGQDSTGKDVRKERKINDQPGAMGRNADEKTGNYSMPKNEQVKPKAPAPRPADKKPSRPLSAGEQRYMSYRERQKQGQGNVIG